MAQTAITINGRQYNIACEDGQENRLLELGKMIDGKAKMLISALGQINESLLLVMVCVILADEIKENQCKNVEENPQKDNSISNVDENLDNLISSDIYKLLEQLKTVANTVKKL